MIRTVIFDFGGVVADFDNSLFISRLSKKSPLSLEAIEREIYGKKLDVLFEKGLISSRAFYYEVKKRCYLKMDYESFKKAYINIFTPVNGMLSIIRSLKKKGYRVQLLSNTNYLHFYNVIRHYPAVKLMDAVSLSFRVGAMKPSRRIYMDAVKKAKCRVEECLYVDDIKSLVEAAEEIGMKGIVFKNPKRLKQGLKSFGIVV